MTWKAHTFEMLPPLIFLIVGDDIDGDGFIGAGDNCPDKYNADQLDTDDDGTSMKQVIDTWKSQSNA